DFHNYIISNPSDTFDSVKISIDAFDYKMMAQNEIPPQQILLQTMQKTYFTRLFNKYYFSSLTDIFNN
ncbi:MAG: hypothetical protein EBS19_11590, partial [Spirochaetia bacterium]|nr:hypothetical protein [Spirochaetia bacterium]